MEKRGERSGRQAPFAAERLDESRLEEGGRFFTLASFVYLVDVIDGAPTVRI